MYVEHEVRLISAQRSCPNLKIAGHLIPIISVAKTAEVHINETLSWAEHIEKISQKLSTCIESLKRVQKL